MPAIQRNATTIQMLNDAVHYFYEIFEKQHVSPALGNTFDKEAPFQPEATSDDVIKYFLTDKTQGVAYAVAFNKNKIQIVTPNTRGAKIWWFARMSRAFWLVFALHRFDHGNSCHSFKDCFGHFEKIFSYILDYSNNQNLEHIASDSLQERYNEPKAALTGANIITLLIEIISEDKIIRDLAIFRKLIEINQKIINLLTHSSNTLAKSLSAFRQYGGLHSNKNGYFFLMEAAEKISRCDNKIVIDLFTEYARSVIESVPSENLIKGLLRPSGIRQAEDCGFEKIPGLFSYFKSKSASAMSIVVFNLLIKITTNEYLESMISIPEPLKQFELIQKNFLSVANELENIMTIALGSLSLSQKLITLTLTNTLFRNVFDVIYAKTVSKNNAKDTGRASVFLGYTSEETYNGITLFPRSQPAVGENVLETDDDQQASYNKYASN